jgi:hypothetical protein
MQTRRAPLQQLRRLRVHLLLYQMCIVSTPRCLKKSYLQKRYLSINLRIVRLNLKKGKNYPLGLYTSYLRRNLRYCASTLRRILQKDLLEDLNP